MIIITDKIFIHSYKIYMYFSPEFFSKASRSDLVGYKKKLRQLNRSNLIKIQNDGKYGTRTGLLNKPYM